MKRLAIAVLLLLAVPVAASDANTSPFYDAPAGGFAGGTLTLDTNMADDIHFGWGDGTDYFCEYVSASTHWICANLTGTIWTVTDGAVDVLFAGTLTTNADADIEGRLVVGNGSALDGNVTMRVDRDFTTPDDNVAYQLRVGGVLTTDSASGFGAQTFRVDPEFVINSGQAHNWITGTYLGTPVITETSGTVTNSATLRIAGPPTAADNNYSLIVDSGLVDLGGVLNVTGNTTLGGTLGGLSSTKLSFPNDGDLKVANNAETTYATLDEDALYFVSSATSRIENGSLGYQMRISTADSGHGTTPSGNVAILSGDQTNSNNVASGSVVIITGDTTATDGDTGDITLRTGSAAAGQIDAGDIQLQVHGANTKLMVVGATGDVAITHKRRHTVDADTIADSGDGNPATHSLEPTSSQVQLTCNDVHTCDVTMAEANAVDGDELTIVNVSANVCDFADTVGLSELAGAFAMGQYDSLQLIYIVDRWVETSRSDN